MDERKTPFGPSNSQTFAPVITPPASGPESTLQLYALTESEWPSRSPSGSGGATPMSRQEYVIAFSCATALGAAAESAIMAVATPQTSRKKFSLAIETSSLLCEARYDDSFPTLCALSRAPCTTGTP